MTDKNKKIWCPEREGSSSVIGKAQLIEQPSTTKVWRYLSTEKFLFTLATQSFYFPTLGQLDDNNEGDLEKARVILKKSGNGDALKDFKNLQARENFRVLCFYNSETECDLMWRAFCPMGGVAVVSTAQKIVDCLETNRESHMIRVVYGNDEWDRIHPIGVKAGEFKSENEIRIIQGKEGRHVKKSLENNKKWSDDDEYVKINEWNFVDELYISPNNKAVVKSMIEEIHYKELLKIPQFNLTSSKISRR